jgi:hypothetical protein
MENRFEALPLNYDGGPEDVMYLVYTAKNQYRKFEANIPRKGIARPQFNFNIHVSVSDLYNPTTDLPILLQVICGPILGIYTRKLLTDT